MKRIIVAITGASGAILGIRLLQALSEDANIERHLIISAAGRITVSQETTWKIKEVEALASIVHQPTNIGATIASGSFGHEGMVIIPCSIKTLSAVANSYADDLISRAADVTLKEGQHLILVVRETPLHLGHLRLMVQAAEIGAVIFPPVPAYYVRPASIEEMIDNTIGRILSRLGLDNALFTPWRGLGHQE